MLHTCNNLTTMFVCQTLSKIVCYLYAAHHFCNISYFSRDFCLAWHQRYQLIMLLRSLYRLSIVQGKLIYLTPSEWSIKIFPSFMNSCNTHLSMYHLILSVQEFADFLYPLPEEANRIIPHRGKHHSCDKDADIQGILITMSNDLTQHMYLFHYNLLLLKLE